MDIAAAAVAPHQYSKTGREKSGVAHKVVVAAAAHLEEVSGFLPSVPADNNPSETRTRFLPGLKNSCGKPSVLLGSTLLQGGGVGFLFGQVLLRVLRAPLVQTVCTHSCWNISRQQETLANVG